MSAIYIVDTSVLLNILDVPGRNQDRETVFAEFKGRIQAGDRFQLPIAAIIETGNHIASISNGAHRRRYAEKFCDMAVGAIEEQAPWVVTPTPGVREIRKWLEKFPDHAMRELGIADTSIIHAWEAACRRNQDMRVAIWSLDQNLAAYNRIPQEKPFGAKVRSG